MLRGVGMWIWQVRACEGGDVRAIAARAHEAGLSHVLVKIADGRQPYNGDVGPLVSALREVGIDVWAWQYAYGNDPAGEARFAAARFREQPYAGFVIDAEQEYKGHPDRARAYMAALREELPHTTIALSSYYLPRLHQEFPWREFLAGCDLVMPQVYWARRGPTLALTQSLEQFAVYGTPVAPTGATDPDYCFTPSELREFLQLVSARGLPACNLWEWRWTTQQHWGIIAAMREVIGVRNRLATVAREAPHAAWMRESYAIDRRGRRWPLLTTPGFCAAWAGECLAHAYEPNAPANSRFTAGPFRFADWARTADEWGDHLAAGGDADLGRWIDRPNRPDLRPGDMLFWRAGVRGYNYADGHVAIVVEVGDRILVSENSSSRGIGVHPISTAALATVGGLKRWEVEDVRRQIKVVRRETGELLADDAEFDGERVFVPVRLLERLPELKPGHKWRVHGQHVSTQSKVYLEEVTG